MNHTFSSCIRGAVGALVLALMAAPSARAQQIYSQNFDSDDSANWVVLQGSQFGNLGEASRANFSFDYSKAGIPSAPHSTGGTTIGLQLLADVYTNQIGSVTGAGLSVSPTNFSITANFDMHADMWINYNGSGPATLTTGGGGNGSSIFYGCGYGTAGTLAQVAGTADSVYVGTCTDNGSAAQMRMYGSSQTGSYQNGVYQLSGTTTPNPGGDNFVYNNAAGTRTFANLAPFNGFFPATKPPQAQINLYPQQTNIQCFAGLIDFAWHDVEVQKIANVIIYKIDGHIIATANTASAGPISGSYLTFLAFDINGNGSLDPNYTNLNFVVFDNIRVSNYVNIVTVQATTPHASEIGPTPGVFTISRTSAGVPLTVNYTLTGTATNGVQYQTTPSSVTFSSTASTTNVTITPIDDGIPSLQNTVVMTILDGGTNYTGAGSDTVFIADGDTPTLDITCTQNSAYERYGTNAAGLQDYLTYVVTRRGNTTISLNANLTFGGTAVIGTDIVLPPTSLAFGSGVLTNTFTVMPLYNPAVTSSRTVTMNVAPGSGYNVGVAAGNTGTILDSDEPAAAVVLTDPLTSAGDAGNWNITFGTGDPVNHSADYEVNFGFDLVGSAYGGVPIPLPPDGNGTALRMTCNKQSGAGNAGAPGAVNAYYKSHALSGNYAVRFNMYLVEGEQSINTGAGEGAVFGINHSGSYSNWWYGGGTLASGTWSSDGVWYFVSCQFGGTLNGEYQEFTGIGGTNGNTGWQRVGSAAAPTFANVFKSNPGPFTSLDDTSTQTGGVPANGPTSLGYAGSWADVEIEQINNVVSLFINHSFILSYQNTTVWTNGYLMLGYADPYGATVETEQAAVYYANLSVVQLTAPNIMSVGSDGNNVTVTFSTPDGNATTANLILQSSPNVQGPFSDVSANIVATGNGSFSATTPVNGAQEFYRVRYQ